MCVFNGTNSVHSHTVNCADMTIPHSSPPLSTPPLPSPLSLPLPPPLSPPLPFPLVPPLSPSLPSCPSPPPLSPSLPSCPSPPPLSSPPLPSPQSIQCQTCRCRPLWCLHCMGKWFASRQDQNTPHTWMTGTAPCPMCRSVFCMLDILLVTNSN